jgi:WD40 repeat protein
MKIAVLLIALSAAGQSLPGDRVITSDAEVRLVSFTSDGRMLAGTSMDGKLRLWDVGSGELKKSFAWDQGDLGVTLSGPAGLLASVDKDGNVKLWDFQSGKPTRRAAGLKERAKRLTLSADGKVVAGSDTKSSENTVRLWDASGAEKFAVGNGLGGTSAMAISPDGSTVVASSYDTNVRAWSARNGELLRLIEDLPVSMFAVAFSPDGKYLATAGVDKTVYLWDAKTFHLSRKLVGQPEMISAIAFSPDSRMLLSGGFSEFTENNPVKILLWDVASGKVLRSMPSPHIVQSLAFSPDGKLAASAYAEKSVGIWAIPGR